jgi:hypothetical protein
MMKCQIVAEAEKGERNNKAYILCYLLPNGTGGADSRI